MNSCTLACVQAAALQNTSVSVRFKPRLRGVSHQIFFFVSLISGVALVLWTPSLLVACIVYAISLSTMFGVSALYHRPTWSEANRRRMRRLDHAAIGILIAGNVTPIAMQLPSSEQRILVAAIWIGALLSTLRAMFWTHAPKPVAAAIALALGWTIAPYIPELYVILGKTTFLWIVVGGLFYSIGALFYAFKWPKLWPAVFGYHEAFHLLVIAAAICHFVAVVRAVQ